MRALVSPTGKPIVLRAVQPNAGIQADYQKRLDALIDAMHKSIMFQIKAQYRANTPELAQDGRFSAERDGSPANALRRAMHRMSRRWLKAFNAAAPSLAAYFADKATGTSDVQLAGILKKSGFSVKFTMTPEANDAIQATIGENVSLIKSIASEYLADVEGTVMRSVQRGQDLATLSADLQNNFGVTKRRAALIARDQNNKATATINMVRQRQLGITQAVWQHSHAGKHPRPSHVAANGKTYDVTKGLYLEGEWVLPGEAINCRCTSKPIIPGFID